MPTKSNNIGGRGGARIGAGRKKSAVYKEAVFTPLTANLFYYKGVKNQ